MDGTVARCMCFVIQLRFMEEHRTADLRIPAIKKDDITSKCVERCSATRSQDKESEGESMASLMLNYTFGSQRQ